MPKISNEKKMEVIKSFLDENGIAYVENHKSGRCGVIIPLAVPKHKVAVRIGDDQDFYLKTRGVYYPIFIRDEDTKEKVLEKIQNTIIKSMKRGHDALARRKR